MAKNDTLGRLADTSLRSSTNVVLNQHQCQYSGHLRSKMTRTDGSCQDYTHDGADLSVSLKGAGGIGGLLGRSHGYSGGAGTWSTHHAYHADGGGNITALVASNQTLSATYKYDPYGRSVSTSGSMAAANTQRFSSKEIIPSTGFYYYGYRFYDPEHQRWLNRDPIEEAGGINLYQFVYNTPLSWIDPHGDEAATIGVVIVVGAELPWYIPPVGAAIVGGAVGVAVGDAINDITGDWGTSLGNWWCPIKTESRGHAERNIQGINPKPWKGWRPDPKRPGWGWVKNPQSGKKNRSHVRLARRHQIIQIGDHQNQ